MRSRLFNAAVANSKGNLAPALETMRIGELARRTGRSVHSIRWYESIGLVPGVRRDAGNRRDAIADRPDIAKLELLIGIRSHALRGKVTSKHYRHEAKPGKNVPHITLRETYIPEIGDN